LPSFLLHKLFLIYMLNLTKLNPHFEKIGATFVKNFNI
jgi:hypothetical protein